MIRVVLLALLSLSFGLAGLASTSAAVLYSTQFDQGQGYDSQYELAGQQGWSKDTASGGGNGLITDFNGSQAAYVGFFDLRPADDFINVWYPINHTPVTNQAPVVKFSVDVTIVDSTTTNRDDFFWSVYNLQTNRLFTIDFDNKDLGIYYVLDGSSDWAYSEADFENDVTYKFQITMDFARKKWSAALSGTNILKDLPMTTVGAELTLADIDAVWAVFDRNKPGDNFMIFDNYLVETEALVARPTVQALGRITNGAFLLRIFGQSGSSYAVETSTNFVNWMPRKTNIVIDTSFDYRDNVPGPLPLRFYRARLVP